MAGVIGMRLPVNGNLAATDIVAVSEVSIMIKRFGKQQTLVIFVQLFLKKQLGIINSPDYNSSYLL